MPKSYRATVLSVTCLLLLIVGPGAFGCSAQEDGQQDMSPQKNAQDWPVDRLPENDQKLIAFLTLPRYSIYSLAHAEGAKQLYAQAVPSSQAQDIRQRLTPAAGSSLELQNALAVIDLREFLAWNKAAEPGIKRKDENELDHFDRLDEYAFEATAKILQVLEQFHSLAEQGCLAAQMNFQAFSPLAGDASQLLTLARERNDRLAAQVVLAAAAAKRLEKIRQLEEKLHPWMARQEQRDETLQKLIRQEYWPALERNLILNLPAEESEARRLITQLLNHPDADKYSKIAVVECFFDLASNKKEPASPEVLDILNSDALLALPYSHWLKSRYFEKLGDEARQVAALNDGVQAGDVTCAYHLGVYWHLLKKTEYAKARTAYQRAMELGQGQAAVYLAQLHIDGLGGAVSMDEAVRCYLRGIKLGSAMSASNLSYLYFADKTQADWTEADFAGLRQDIPSPAAEQKQRMANLAMSEYYLAEAIDILAKAGRHREATEKLNDLERVEGLASAHWNKMNLIPTTEELLQRARWDEEFERWQFRQRLKQEGRL